MSDFYLTFSIENLYTALREIEEAIAYFQSSTNVLDRSQALYLQPELRRVNSAIQHVLASNLHQQNLQIEPVEEESVEEVESVAEEVEAVEAVEAVEKPLQ